MSIQLIVFPQSYDGIPNGVGVSNPQMVATPTDFTAVTAATSVSLGAVANVSQAAINAIQPTITPNTWAYGWATGGAAGSGLAGGITIHPYSALLQNLGNLVVNEVYNLFINWSSSAGSSALVSIYNGTVLTSQTSVISSTSSVNIQFTAPSVNNTTIVISYNAQLGAEVISSVYASLALFPLSVGQVLENGQVICDLYEDEDIPLSLSVDNFKNVAEQVQSYSKAFNLPATKRNNQIFDNIFEITRTDTGLNFNPYKRTKTILKQDGFLLFEGNLRLIDIQDKEGEISYNVNLYSEVIAVADLLGERTFNDIDFIELEHDYTYSNIRNSWQGILDLTYTLLTGSFAGTPGTSTTSVLRYPFVDWGHQFTADANGPVLPRLESAFRPFVNIKYLINRIFAATPFTYESTFFDTADFGELFMDFNWGSNENGSAPAVSENVTRTDGQGSNYYINQTTYNSASKLRFDTGTSSSNWNNTDYKYTSPVNNLAVNVPYWIELESTATVSSYSNSLRIAKFDQYSNLLEVLAEDNNSISAGAIKKLNGSFATVLQNGEYIQAQSKVSTANKIRMNTGGNASYMTFIASNDAMQTYILLNQLRGDLGQWDFLKGIMTMFNLVSIPDKENPSNIKIEPYADVFINNADSTELDWTDKIDVSEMKLTPLTDLNKKTIFKFVEDDEDYAFMNYKTSVGGHLYGSKKFDASGFTILAGENEVVAEPFAATVPKALMTQYPDLISPAIYSYNEDDGTSAAFENSPRIMYKNGVKTLTSCTYYVPAQNGGAAVASEDEFLQFSHLTDIPTVVSNPPATTDTTDFHFGECQLMDGVGAPTTNNLFNFYWLPYYNELYNPDTRTMTIKVNLSPSDISEFNFYDPVMIKNRTYRVNKIDYKPNDLATVEFILIP